MSQVARHYTACLCGRSRVAFTEAKKTVSDLRVYSTTSTSALTSALVTSSLSRFPHILRFEPNVKTRPWWGSFKRQADAAGISWLGLKSCKEFVWGRAQTLVVLRTSPQTSSFLSEVFSGIRKAAQYA